MFTALRDYAPLVLVAFNVLLLPLWAWGTWSLGQRFVTRGDAAAVAASAAEVMARLRDDVSGIARRVDHVEAAILHLPTQDNIHQLSVQMTRVEGAVATLAARLEGMGELLDRVERTVARHEAIFSDAARGGRT
ncbi:MAG: hypothetical protein OHK0024_24280 [Thalassobaculales bacterium]